MKVWLIMEDFALLYLKSESLPSDEVVDRDYDRNGAFYIVEFE